MSALAVPQVVLDACCGGRMFWFNRADPRAVFVDKRRERCEMKDRGKTRVLDVSPDLIADFTALPFKNDTFALVSFDPPHLVRAGKDSWMAKKYGRLVGDWKDELRRGFLECFRVLRPQGVLVFKWNETHVPVSQILALAGQDPLFGNRCGKRSKSHWIVFMKGGEL